jgi:copper chaperone CopZ
LNTIDGVLEHETDFQNDVVELRYDADQVTIDEIMDELEGVGYRPQSWEDLNDES